MTAAAGVPTAAGDRSIRFRLVLPVTRLGVGIWSIDAIEQRCARHGVEVTDIGVFTGDGRLVVRRDGHPVVDLDTGFLHDGRPRRHMAAEIRRPERTPTGRPAVAIVPTLLALLAHPNINSRERILRRYDHEIGGATLGRPIIGVERDAPGDAALLAGPLEASGIAIGIGANPFHGLHDPEWMAWSVVDEAIRNVVAVGADPTRSHCSTTSHSATRVGRSRWVISSRRSMAAHEPRLRSEPRSYQARIR